MRKKFFLTSAAVLLAVATLQSAQAATDVQKVIDETYVQPEYVLGSSLTEDQKNQTLKNVFKYNKKAFLIQKNCPYITLVRHRTLI